MGRSVSYPSGAIVAFTLLEVDDDGDWDFEYEWLRADLSERAAAAFPSLAAHDGWRGREDRILRRNAFADFGVSVYGGLIAVCVVERDDGAYWDAEWRTARSPGRSNGSAKSRLASTRCSGTTIASDICRTARAFTASAAPETEPIEPVSA